MLCGVFSGKRVQSGSALTTAARISVVSSPSNALLPVSSSYSTQPNAQMSVALVHRLARAPARDSCTPPCPESLRASSPPCSASVNWRDRRCRVALERLRQAEVQHLHLAFGRHLHVGGLQVAVNDAFLVRGFQRLGDLLAIVRASSIGTAPSRLTRSASVSPDTSSITR